MSDCNTNSFINYDELRKKCETWSHQNDDLEDGPFLAGYKTAWKSAISVIESMKPIVLTDDELKHVLSEEDSEKPKEDSKVIKINSNNKKFKNRFLSVRKK